MKKYFEILWRSIAIIFVICCVSCSEITQTKVVDVAFIHVSEDKTENLKVAKDLGTYDFRGLINEKISSLDAKVLDGVSWQTTTPTDGSDLIFQLVLKDAAVAHEDSILKIVKIFIDKTLAEYHKTVPTMDEVEVAAEYYMHLIETSTIDTIWLKTSPTLARFASKDDFNNSLKQRKILFKPLGTRRIENRRVSGELGADIKGSFYTIIFVYENDEHEEVTLEKIGNEYKLLGYRFYVKK